MRSIKIAAAYVFIAALILSGCDNKTTTDMKNKLDSASSKVGQTLDTVGKKMGNMVDSAKNKLNNAGDNDVKVTDADTSQLFPVTARAYINEALNEYKKLKDALYKDDSSNVSILANRVKKSIENIKTDDVSPKMVGMWKQHTAQISKFTDAIAGSNNLTKVRQSFSNLSDALYSTIKMHGLDGKTLYKISCESKGQYWVSDKKDTDSPYISGKDAKKDCGKVVEAIKFP